MTERLLLVSTCGTSLLTNGTSAEDRAWLTKVANDCEVDSSRLGPIVEDRRAVLAAADEPTRCRMSAELNGIAAVHRRYTPRQVSHVIVHTDTALGKAAAQLVDAALGNAALLLSAAGLRTDNLSSFRAALADLSAQLDTLVASYRAQGWFVVFNLTGGFKSLNGYLQTLAMILADRCVFLFEGAPELMEIPRLPVRLAEVDELRAHARTFRQLAVGYAVAADAAQGVPDSLLMEVDGEVTTSTLGDVAWARHRATLFSEQLHPPLSRKLQVAESVRREFAGLQSEQKMQVNEALDEFSAYLDNARELPRSRLFKKLLGKPVPGSTHELYAWSDGAAGRLLGHFEPNGVFVVDRLTKHL
ncbi:MAG: putative CRISPR-associated protein [Thermoanaerobaculia bacterium]|nr:MAG: putative CRISPR-associated protein [Thermoanaerobaculia bacterium]MBZ0102115.1 putative CRISPR-associated protein [Thermoanaerobaculia bacterium]